jgi:large repetitive protein
MTKMHGAKFHKGHRFDYVAGTDGDDVINGGRGTQIVDAGGGNDSVNGGSGRDLIFGGAGKDQLVGGRRGDLVFGGSGDDLIDTQNSGGSSGHHGRWHNGDGADALFGDGYESFGDLVKGKKVSAPGNDTIRGGNGGDLIFGDNGDLGKAGGNDLLEGGNGSDVLFGEGGADRLVGGRGADIMDGGAGADVFVYGHKDDSRGWGVDVIRNFVQGEDKIDLTGALAGKDFKWGGNKPTANGVWFEQKGGCTLICVDLDGNPKSPDMVIRLDGKFKLTADDFKAAGEPPPTNTPPVANADTASTNEDTAVTIAVLANDTDADGDALTVTGASAGHGTVSVNANGTLTYTPAGNYNGSDTITYTISDGKGGTATGSVAVTVAAVNDAPVAANDKATTSEDTPVTVAVLANDGDADGDALSVTSASAAHGTVVVNANGTLTYTPNANYNGSDTITYSISDGKGGTSSATVAVTVNGGNDAPVAVGDTAATDEDTSVTVAVLGNDSDADGDKLTVTGASALHGTVAVNGDGTLTYTPNANYNGGDTITYGISDGKGGTASATVAVTVNSVNDNPVAAGDGASTAEDTAVTINVLGNDSDADGDQLAVTGASASHGTVTVNGDGTLTYTPDANYTGGDTIAYSISDGKGGTATGTVAVGVGAENDGPVAQDDAATTSEDTAVTIAVLANDSDADGDSLSVTSASAGHGSVTINGDGTLTYTPDANYHGGDTITYSISDGKGGASSATVAVTVNAVNDGPTAGNDSTVTDEDTDVTVAVLGNDGDIDGDLLSVTAASAAHGTVTVNDDGTLTYKGDSDFNGADTITYTIDDGHGGTAVATVAVTVNAVNDAPVAADDAATIDEDSAVSIEVLANDGDVDGGTPFVTEASAAHGTVSVNEDGTLFYTPDENYNGSDSITYTISDGQGDTAQANVSVTVNPVNDAPVAGNDSAVTDEDTAIKIAVLGNDSDIDGDTLSIAGASAAHGTVVVNGDGTLTYTPNANYNGSDTITYSVDDGHGGSASATVAVTVNAVNDAPAAVNDQATVNEDSFVRVVVLANDSDVDGDKLTVTEASALHGTVVINANGTLNYFPGANYNGGDTITYSISDGKGGTSTAAVTVTVNPVNDAPVVGNETAVTDEDTAVSINVLDNDSDVDGDALAVSGASALHGSVTINADGSLTYSPAGNYNGADTITYTVTDGKGGTATATVAVTVNPVNDVPVASDDAVSIDEDNSITFAPLQNDSDADGDPLTVLSAAAEHGAIVVNSNGTLTYTPNANFAGTDHVTYTISDGNGGTATATVTITVNPVNDPPIAIGDTAVTNEDTAVDIDVLANDSDADGDTLTIESASAGNGTVTVNPDGTLHYAPTANFHGADTITYTINDGHGATSTATVVVTVNSVNDLPVANGETAVVNEDGLVRIAVLANDSDADGDALSVSSASARNGTVVINPNNTIDYMPNTDFFGTDAITYSISDGHGGVATTTVTVTVNPINDGPTANSEIWYVSTAAATTVDAGRLLANDSDRDGGQLNITAINGAGVGTTVTLANGVMLTLLADGNIAMSAPLVLGATASATFTYTISDGTSTATATSTVTLLGTGGAVDNINLSGMAGGTDPYTFTYVNVRSNSETVTGTAGNDMLFGDSGVDHLFGGAGDDLLDGGIQAGEMSGGAGNDTVRGSSGNDTLNGGDGGEDMLDLSYATGGLSFTLVQSAAVTTVLLGGALGTDKYSNIEGVVGSNFNDTLNGSTANDILRGDGGDDTINGNGGVDIIDFSDATGALDFTLVQSGTATSFTAAGLGTDNYKNIEGVAGGNFDDTLTGSASGDVLRGGGGEDLISGGLGADKLRGGTGADTLTGGSGSDRFEYVRGDLTGASTDSIGDFQAGAGGDVLDISELLVGYGGGSLVNLVQVIDTGDGNTLVRVDIDGSGSTFGFQNAAVLTGVSGITLTDMVTNGNIDATV